MRSINCRINIRATSAGIALWAVKNKLNTDDLRLIESELARAYTPTMPSSMRLASILTAEILLRQHGAAL